jgi:tryptophan synthase alpha chain
MSQIRKKFAELRRADRGGFIPFITAGDPTLSFTESLLVELGKAGADLIELGVPFSDPVADGEVIQRACERALRNGATLQGVLECASRAKSRIDAPIILFSYFNPILQFGQERLAAAARDAGIAGILVTDLLPEEARSWTETLLEHELDPIFLVAPTTSPQRLAGIAQRARGFIYAVSRTGVTGARDAVGRDARPLVERVRAVTDLPVAVGFGISTADQIRQVWRFADAAVIGSAIVGEIEKFCGRPDLVQRIADFTRSLLAKR